MFCVVIVSGVFRLAVQGLLLAYLLTGDKQTRSQLSSYYLSELFSQLSSVIETPSLGGADVSNGK